MEHDSPIPRSNVTVLSNVAVRDASRSVLMDFGFRKFLRGRDLLRTVAMTSGDVVPGRRLERRQAEWMTDGQWGEYAYLPCPVCGRRDFGPLPPDGRRYDYVECRCVR